VFLAHPIRIKEVFHACCLHTIFEVFWKGFFLTTARSTLDSVLLLSSSGPRVYAMLPHSVLLFSFSDIVDKHVQQNRNLTFISSLQGCNVFKFLQNCVILLLFLFSAISSLSFADVVCSGSIKGLIANSLLASSQPKLWLAGQIREGCLLGGGACTN